MKQTLEAIQKHIEDTFYKEKPATRYGFTEKYTSVFDDIVYKVSVEKESFDLHEVVKELQGPLFKYNNDHSELFICSPIFRLLFNLNGSNKFSDIPVEKWFDRTFWDNQIKHISTFNGLSYTTKEGDIPEFMGLIQKKDDGNIAVHVLRSPYLINLEYNHEFLATEAPLIFELDNSDPIHLVRFLMARK